MLTDEERKVFAQLLDANYDANQNPLDEDLRSDVSYLKQQLRKLMGDVRYWTFMQKGAAMFA